MQTTYLNREIKLFSQLAAFIVLIILSTKAIAGLPSVIDVSQNQNSDINSLGKTIYTRAPQGITLNVQIISTGRVKLEWSSSTPVTEGTYSVQRQTLPSGGWDVLKLVPFNATLEYYDTISAPFCSPTPFNYQVILQSSISANDTSNVSQVTGLSDQTNPANVQNLSVGINSAGSPVLSWTQIPGDSIKGFLINRYNGTNWPTIDTVSKDSSSFTDISVPFACDTAYRYVVITVDQCDRRSAPDYALFVQTIKLDSLMADKCERKVNLTWNMYNAMPGGLGGYKIFRSTDNSAFVNIDTTLNTSFTDNFNFLTGHTYAYYVEAYSANGQLTSSSCQKVFTYNGPTLPDSVYISRVSVKNDIDVEVGYHYTPVNTLKKLFLQRFEPQGGIGLWISVDSLTAPASGFLPQAGLLNDTTANVHSQSYCYRLLGVDSCTSVYSVNTSCSMFLRCEPAGNDNTLWWNVYETWREGVNGHSVYRQVDNLPVNGTLINTLSPTSYDFAESSSGFPASATVCYWVVADENPGNPYLVNATSLSNTCCIIKESTVFMPTAFRPSGKNMWFRPVFTFVDPASFSMTIYNKWGQQIFETNDIYYGWDGSVKGQTAPEGLYSYIITYSALGGGSFTKRGTVLLVK